MPFECTSGSQPVQPAIGDPIPASGQERNGQGDVEGCPAAGRPAARSEEGWYGVLRCGYETATERTGGGVEYDTPGLRRDVPSNMTQLCPMLMKLLPVAESIYLLVEPVSVEQAHKVVDPAVAQCELSSGIKS